jgi:RNA polymerase sigma-70 factor (ECF subfamily)
LSRDLVLDALERHGGAPARSAAIAAAVADIHARGSSAWPAIDLSLDDLAAHVGALVGADPSYAAALADVRADDLYVAAAAALGAPGAREAFVHAYLARVGEYVGRVDGSAAFADEVRQELATRLLVVAEDGRPGKLAAYTGRGPLAGFVRVSAVRVAQNKKRGKRLDVLEDVGPRAPVATGADPELAYLKERYAHEFAGAFRATLATLSPEQREVLRLHYIDGLSIDEVGARCAVSRATAARWLAKARERVLRETERRLKERLGASVASPASVIGLARSRIDLRGSFDE